MTTSAVTDEAVEAAAVRIAAWSFEDDPTYKWDDLDAEDKGSAREGMRAALEAAVPLLAPQPVASQERVAEVLYTAMCKTGDDCEDLAAALLAAGVFVAPQPVEVVVDHRPGETCSVAASVDPDTGFSRTPQPVVDREAVWGAIYRAGKDSTNMALEYFEADDADVLTDAVLALIDGTAK
jgi:hypothetical protein